MAFVHLNTRSKASMLCGSADISDLVKKAQKNGQSSLALTDYNNLYNSIAFYKECVDNNIKPILGVDIYFCEDAQQSKIQRSRSVSRITLLAENNVGLKNIARIISLANDEDHFYYNPRIDFNALEKYKEGIICLTGSSLDGIISSNLYDKTSSSGEILEPAALFKAEGILRRLLRIFNNQTLYLEVQDNNLPVQKIINARLRSLAKKYNLKTIATNNVHYVEASDAEAHRTLLEMGSDKFNKLTDTDFSQEEYYLKNFDEMQKQDFLEEELSITNTIAERCNVTIDLKKKRLPKYSFVPNGYSSMQWLKKICYEYLDQISKSDIYKQRLERELIDIEEMGFADYFLIVHDVISWIKKQKILLGYGRGSAGGSLVSYVLGITQIDPIKYGLIWERFLNKGRGGLPDIDTDVPRSQRQKVLDYIRERFGHQNVAQLVTLGGLQAKAILKEVFRVYDMPFDEANKITALVPSKNDEHIPISLQEAIDTVPELKRYYDVYTPWFKVALALEGCYKSIGIHAAAVVISDTSFEDSFYPLTRSKDGDLIFGWDMNTVDSLNLLKLDILGLTTLDDIQLTFDLVQKRRGIKIEREKIPLDDEITWTMIGQGFTIGIFQIEKQLGRTWSKNLEPNSIQQLSDLVSLIRPGPMESNMHTAYRAVKMNGSEPLYIDDSLRPIMNETFSALLYQEQVIEICKQLANMSLIDADKVRKAMGKKKPEEMKKWKEQFINGCHKNTISVATSEEIWSYIEKFAGYGFNKSHGIGYALLAYETAYLKANYTVEFICAKLQHAESHPDKFEQMSALVYDAKLFDINILPPRVKHANKDFSIIDDKNIVFGLSALKGIGKSTISEILKISKDHSSFDDIIWHVLDTSTKINSTAMLALIRSGAFDDQIEHRVECQRKFKLLESLTSPERQSIKDLYIYQEGKKDWIKIIRALSDEDKSAIIKEEYKIKIPNARRRESLRVLIDEYDRSEIFDSKAQNIAWEQSYLGISLSGSEADIYKASHRCIDIVKNGYSDMLFEIAVCIDSTKEIITKKGDPMAFVTARDKTYVMDNIVVFPRTFATSKTLLESGNVIKIRGKIDDRGSLIAERIERLK